jgi:hypothetical protein
MITGAVLAVARDADRITWEPAAWPGDDITRRRIWRAQLLPSPSPWRCVRTARSLVPGLMKDRVPTAVSGQPVPP